MLVIEEDRLRGEEEEEEEAEEEKDKEQQRGEDDGLLAMEMMDRTLGFRKDSAHNHDWVSGQERPSWSACCVRLNACARRSFRKLQLRASDRNQRRFALVLVVVAALYLYFMSIVIIPRQLTEGIDRVTTCEYFESKNLRRRRQFLPDALQGQLRVGIMTFYGGLDEEMKKASMKNKYEYARRHDYEVLVGDSEIDQSRPTAWSKFPIMMRYLPDYDYMMWIDADALFMNMSIKVEDLIDFEHDLFLAKDESDIQTGVFIIKNSDFSLWWLQQGWAQTWLVTGIHPYKYEQRAIQYMHGVEAMVEDAKSHGKSPYPYMQQVRAKTKIMPFCAFNSNICEEFWTGLILYRRTKISGWVCENVYRTGDFIIHLAGKSPNWYRNWIFLKFAKLAEERRDF